MISLTAEKRHGPTIFPLAPERFFWPQSAAGSIELLPAGLPAKAAV
jgi:hypothetical protein